MATKVWNFLVSFVTPSKATQPGGLGSISRDKVEESVNTYESFFDEKDDGKKEKLRREKTQDMVNFYYDLVTDFYEYGWGQSFHFAPRYSGQTFSESITRHEHYLGAKTGLAPGKRCLDIGCGVGGPMREIARFTLGRVTGINNNAYQVGRCQYLNKQAGIENLCDVVKGDFMKMPFDDATFDCAYAIEATCHAPNMVDVYKEIKRVMKDGGIFATYEWGVTDKYDEKNERHRHIKHIIEEGDGLPGLINIKLIKQAAIDAGFEVLEDDDLAVSAPTKYNFNVGWWATLAGSWSNPRMSKLGCLVTHGLVYGLETIKIAPKGTTAAHGLLHKTAIALVEGGELGIFTPMYLLVLRKPNKK